MILHPVSLEEYVISSEMLAICRAYINISPSDGMFDGAGRHGGPRLVTVALKHNRSHGEYSLIYDGAYMS